MLISSFQYSLCRGVRIKQQIGKRIVIYTYLRYRLKVKTLCHYVNPPFDTWTEKNYRSCTYVPQSHSSLPSFNYYMVGKTKSGQDGSPRNKASIFNLITVETINRGCRGKSYYLRNARARDPSLSRLCTNIPINITEVPPTRYLYPILYLYNHHIDRWCTYTETQKSTGPHCP